MKPLGILILLGALVVLLVVGGAFYSVRETETVILTQFGRPVGEPVKTPGLHLKLPFVQEINRLEKRMLAFDAPTTPMTTKDKNSILVDTFGRWRISDPLTWYEKLRDVRGAQSRVEDIIGSEVRAAVANHDLIEIIRSDKARRGPTPTQDQTTGTQLREASFGRLVILDDALAAAKPKLAVLGIELLDIRIKRVNYNGDVLQRIFTRMISEREKIAQRFRSEGEGEAARVLGTKERELLVIESDAYRKVQELRGGADAEASRIYAEAYDQSAEAREFYTFLKTLETYREVLAGKSLVLSTDSPLFGLFRRMK
jgi:membrane protease subunit HflC